MDERLIENIESFGFVSAEAFLRWQFTKYLQEELERLKAEIQVFKDKYDCDFETFEKRFSPEHPEVFEEWDDSMDWEVLEIDLKQTQRIFAEMEENGTLVHHEEEITNNSSSMIFEYHQALEKEHESESEHGECTE